MSPEDIIRAWTDEEFYLGLSDEQRAILPANPAGLIELTDDDLSALAGGTSSSWGCPSIGMDASGSGMFGY